MTQIHTQLLSTSICVNSAYIFMLLDKKWISRTNCLVHFFSFAVFEFDSLSNSFTLFFVCVFVCFSSLFLFFLLVKRCLNFCVGISF